jgi:hypothetical protein
MFTIHKTTEVHPWGIKIPSPYFFNVLSATYLHSINNIFQNIQKDVGILPA